MKVRLPTAAAFALGTLFLASACTSGAAHPSGSAHPSSAGHKSVTVSSNKAGPAPCRLVTAHDISVALKETLVKASGSRSTCSYVNAATTDNVVITTSRTTPQAAKLTVASTARLAKVKAKQLTGIGDKAVVFVRKSKPRTTATCIFAKNKAVVVIVVGSPNAKNLMREVVALAKVAASRA